MGNALIPIMTIEGIISYEESAKCATSYLRWYKPIIKTFTCQIKGSLSIYSYQRSELSFLILII